MEGGTGIGAILRQAAALAAIGLTGVWDGLPRPVTWGGRACVSWPVRGLVVRVGVGRDGWDVQATPDGLVVNGRLHPLDTIVGIELPGVGLFGFRAT